MEEISDGDLVLARFDTIRERHKKEPIEGALCIHGKERGKCVACDLLVQLIDFLQSLNHEESMLKLESDPLTRVYLQEQIADMRISLMIRIQNLDGAIKLYSSV